MLYHNIDELAVLDGGKCILQLRGVRPFLSDKYDITKHPNYKLTADFDERNTFDVQEYLQHRLKLKGDEVCSVYQVDMILRLLVLLKQKFYFSITG